MCKLWKNIATWERWSLTSDDILKAEGIPLSAANYPMVLLYCRQNVPSARLRPIKRISVYPISREKSRERCQPIMVKKILKPDI